MNNNFTHKFVIEVGVDLSEILAPESIQGVKAYLGVKNDADVLGAVAVDQYKKLATAINNGGFAIINSEFMANTPQQPQTAPQSQEQTQEQEVKEPVKAENESVKTESKQPEQTQDKQETVADQKEKIFKPNRPILVKNILEIIKRFVDESSDSVVEKIDIDAEYVNDVPNAKLIYSKTGLSDDVIIDVDELDADTAMIIAYFVDKDSDELQYKVVSEQELEEAPDGQN